MQQRHLDYVHRSHISPMYDTPDQTTKAHQNLRYLTATGV